MTQSNTTSMLPALPRHWEILIILVGSLCCINSYNGKFVFDDSPAITTNPDVTTTELSKIFKNDFWGNKLTHYQSHRSYRPLTIMTFRFHYWLRGQLDPVDFHIVNLILHSFVCLLTYWVFNILLTNKFKHLAFYASALFAVHPVHTEAVSGIVGRADILCTIFVWLSILFYNRSVYSNNILALCINLIITIIFITIAMLCKETGITAIGICVTYDLIIVQKNSLQDFLKILNLNWLNKSKIYDNFRFIIRILLLTLIGFVLLAVRFSLMGFSTPKFQPVDNPASFLDSIYLRHINYHYIYSLNFWLLICPEWLCFDWSMGCVPLISNFDLRIFFIFILWFIIGLMIRFIWIRKKHEDSRYMLMGILMLTIPFLPASNIFFNVGFVIAERTLYLPSAGYLLIFVICLDKLFYKLGYSKLNMTIFGILFITWFARSCSRSSQWNNENYLFNSALSVCPLNAKVHYNVAKSAADMGNILLAELEYKEAIRLHPDYAQAMNNLGNLLKDQEKYNDAEKLLRKAVEIQTDFAAAWMNLGIVLSGLKKFNESKACYLTSLIHRPNCPDCHYNLGILYMEQKKFTEALESWSNAIKQKTNHKRAWTNSIRLLDDMGMTEKALEKGKIAVKLFPNDATIRLNIANILGKIGNFEKAEIEFKNSLNLDSTNPSIYTNLGVLYHRWNKYELARQMYNKALDINPNANTVKINLKKLDNLLYKQKLKNIT
ncbi:protein O-mannosyl-transferase TMTC4-like [Aphidius gifuensis]|uniref:protein O-mannosyl-transferase TMTC4-like n=1 Tax=Aphidius gifuensis TaxID=684658 RepID=UPI001CDB9092|nr:protein O-mannosyl-transferase TMTC4-like [Aphidius gifuensis]